MAANIDLSGVVGTFSTVCTQLRVTLPGGLAVQGSTPHVGASPLQAARATMNALNSAMAPLGPVFSILDAVLAIVKFAKTVPGVVTRPDKVVDAIADVVKKAGALASLVPQLSVPLMVLGVIDVLIALLQGLSAELTAITDLESKADELDAIAQTVEAMGPIATSVRAQATARRSQISCAMSDAQPLLGIVNAFCELVGLPAIALDVDVNAGSLADVAAAFASVVDALVQVRSTIPVP